MLRKWVREELHVGIKKAQCGITRYSAYVCLDTKFVCVSVATIQNF